MDSSAFIWNSSLLTWCHYIRIAKLFLKTMASLRSSSSKALNTMAVATSPIMLLLFLDCATCFATGRREARIFIRQQTSESTTLLFPPLYQLSSFFFSSNSPDHVPRPPRLHHLCLNNPSLGAAFLCFSHYCIRKHGNTQCAGPHCLQPIPQRHEIFLVQSKWREAPMGEEEWDLPWRGTGKGQFFSDHKRPFTSALWLSQILTCHYRCKRYMAV